MFLRRRGSQPARARLAVVVAGGLLASLLGSVVAAAEPEDNLTPQQKSQLDEAKQLNIRAVELYRARKFGEAISLARQALEIRKHVLGEKHPVYAQTLNNLGELYRSMGDYAKAEPLVRQALEIRKEVLGEKHPLYASSLNNLASLYQSMGDNTKAEPLLRQASEILEHALGQKHPDYATSLNNLAELYQSMGSYAKAEPLLRQVLDIRKEVSGEKHPDYAMSLNNLAGLYWTAGDYAKAEPLYRQALEIQRRALGETNPDYANSLNNLALLYQSMGDYAKAEPLYRQASEIYKQALGENHPDYARSLNNLALLFHRMGDYAKAEPLYRQAGDILKQVLGEKHPWYAMSLNNLAGLYKSMGDYAKAEPLYRQALEIHKGALGEKHPTCAVDLNNLAKLHQSMGNYAEAEILFRQVLEIRKEVLGEKRPDYATSLNNLAGLYWTTGDYAKAEPLYRQALEIRKEVLGEKHPLYAQSLGELAVLYAAAGQWQAAAEPMNHARRVIRRHVARVLPSLGEKEQLTFLHETDEDPFHASLTLGMIRYDDAAIARLSASWLLNGKAVIQETLAERARLAREDNRPQTADIAKELRAVRSQLARLSLTVPKPAQQASYQEQVSQFSQREEELSRRLAAATGAEYREDPWVELAQVQRALPAKAVLVEIARFDVFNFQAKGPKKKWLPAHYAAWIIPAAGQGGVAIVDLGEAEKIDAAVGAAKQAMKAAMGSGSHAGLVVEKGEPEAEKTMQESLAAVARLVFDPLVPHLGKAQRLVISPDANLWLVPWGALPVSENQYAIEKYQISYVVTGRDLVIKPGSAAATARPVIFADPNYDLNPEKSQAVARAVLGEKQLAGGEPFRGLDTSRSINALRHAPRLAGTAAEAAAITTKLAAFCGKAPQIYQDQYALKAIFKELHSPQVAVLSTHGYFLPDQEVKHDEREILGSETRDAALTREGKPLENPLLRCGLLLAGCNQGAQSPTGDDGVLTGLEIVGTDLRGTDLVVLSACETGLGQVRNGEGVAGLRQAFQLAGAKAVVATLWQIPDTQSARLMNAFFSNLAAGQSKPDALRNAQLAMIKSRRDRYGAAHPFFWAAFTVTGE